jgi:hypothetical protein
MGQRGVAVLAQAATKNTASGKRGAAASVCAGFLRIASLFFIDFSLMSSHQRAKRLRIDQPNAAPAQAQLPGRDQLVLVLVLVPSGAEEPRELRRAAEPRAGWASGTAICDESELLPCTRPSVGGAKAEIARVQGTEEARQELYKAAVRADGGAVREDDTEAEPMDGDSMILGDGEVVAMAVKELPPFVWRTIAEGCVALIEEGAVASQITEVGDDDEEEFSLTTTGVELTEGKHYWEVELLSEDSYGGIVDIGCYLFCYLVITGVRHLHRHLQAQP